MPNANASASDIYIPTLGDDGEEPFNAPCPEQPLPHEADSARKACKHCLRRIPEFYPSSWLNDPCDVRNGLSTLTPLTVDEQEDGEFEEEEVDPRLTKALELNERVLKARREYEAAAETAKSKKKAWEAYSEDLSDYLKSLTEELPLFDKKAEEPKQEPTIDAPTDGWQDVILAEIKDMPVAAVGKLAEKEIVTLGQFAAYTQKRQLTDIKGIGPAAAEKIEAALTEFWKTWEKEEPNAGPVEA